MDTNSILIIVGIVVLLGVAGGCVFAILKVRQLINKFDTQIDPMLDKAMKTTANLKPAVAQVEGLIQHVNILIDAAHIEVLNVDEKLDKLAGITGTVSNVTETVPKVIEDTKSTVKSRMFKKR
ncbi:MAG: hypothetical protein Q3963_06715 [Coriobacteriaceae bacterium]|nr:hypothetical protein [Coriobacteriaceae bacterium]